MLVKKSTHTNSISDELILRTISDGSPREINYVFTHIYKTCHPLILNHITKNKGNREDAADMFQEVITLFYQHAKSGRFKSDSKIKTYLFAMAKYRWLTRLNRKRNFFAEIEEKHYEISEQGLVEVSVSEQKEEKLLQSINTLKDGMPDVIHDYYYLNLSGKQIAEKYNLGSEQAAKNKKCRALRKLRQLFYQPTQLQYSI